MRIVVPRTVLRGLLIIALVIGPSATPLTAQAHEHTASAPSPDPRLALTLVGPHLILYHRGYLALSDAQVTGLQRLRRVVCDAEVTYVERTASERDRLPAILADSATARPATLHQALNAIAGAESEWLTVLVRARRDALELLTPAQRTQVSALRDHWVRESVAMIEEATRPGERGHPGTQIPIRVPGMVVGATTLLPYCEALHGPATHLSVPPPSP